VTAPRVTAPRVPAPFVPARRVRAAVAAAAVVAGAGACASPGVPPGGPERRTPPRVVRVTPESGAVNVRPREVVFEYDAVVSETPRGGGATGGGAGGTSGLEALVTVSPRSGSVAVDWRRERIAVRPRRGFRPNVTYTVTVLPGIQDLRNNVRDTATIAVFSTGGPIARGSVRGVVYDWTNNRPAARAVVEATAADSTVFFAVADSAGRFVVPNIPAGAYLVRGTVDVNLNRTADPREAFDTARAAAGATGPAPPRTPADTGGVALYAFAHDTLPPRLTGVASSDSVTLRLTFDRPLRPEQPFAGRVRVVASDSTAQTVRSVLTAAAADSIAQGAARTAQQASGGDSAANAPRRGAGAPGEPAAQPPRLGRPVPPTELVVRVAAPLRPNTVYRVRASDLRSLSNVVGTSERTFTTPRAAPAPRPAAPRAAPPAPRPAAPPPPGQRPPTPAAPPPATPPPATPTPAPPPARRP
jgi:hypothetical protein